MSPAESLVRVVLVLVTIIVASKMVLVVGTLMRLKAGRTKNVGGQKSLSMRFGGYTAKDVSQYWKALDDTKGELQREQKLLSYDLWYPFFYGALGVLLVVGAWRLFNFPWSWSLLILLMPATIGACADWIETTIQLRELRAFIRSSEPSRTAAIDLASIATRIKLCSVAVAVALPLGIALYGAGYAQGFAARMG